MAKEPEYNECTWSFVQLGLSGKRLDPVQITKALGIEPDISTKRGDLWRPSKTCKQGSWTLTSNDRNLSLDEQIEALPTRITPVKRELSQIISADETVEYASVSIVLELPPGRYAVGYHFRSAVIGEFTAMGLDIDFSMYPPGKPGKGALTREAQHGRSEAS